MRREEREKEGGRKRACTANYYIGEKIKLNK